MRDLLRLSLLLLWAFPVTFANDDGYYNFYGWSNNCQNYNKLSQNQNMMEAYQEYIADEESNQNYQYSSTNGNDCVKGDIWANNCDDPVIRVSQVTILCNSASTYYYGNNKSHRNSELCDYGDKAFVTVYFAVTQNLDYDSDIYMTFGIYAAKSDYELLYSVRAVELCNNFVGHTCTTAGTYSFTFTAVFDNLYSDKSTFVPVIEMGFSTKSDEGYNLGGVNIDCAYDESYGAYGTFINGNAANVKTKGSGSFASNYGILIGVVSFIAIFAVAAAFALPKISSRIEASGGLLEAQNSFVANQAWGGEPGDKSDPLVEIPPALT